MTTIPDAAIEAYLTAAEAHTIGPGHQGGYRCRCGTEFDWQRSEHERANRHVAQERLTAVLPHLTSAPQAEGDVREARVNLAMKMAEHWWQETGEADNWADLTDGEREAAMENSYAWVHADAVLSSGLVVPVGEVERLEAEATLLKTHLVSEQARLRGHIDRAREEVDRFQEWSNELAMLLPDDDVSTYANPDGAQESIITDCLTAYLRERVVTATSTAAVPARLLSGVHVGREVKLPSLELAIVLQLIEHATSGRVQVWAEGFRHRLEPDDVVTLVDEEGGR